MTSSALEKLLVSHGGRKDGHRVVLESAAATLIVRIGSQSMTIERVKSVDLDDELCSAITSRGDIFAVAIDDVRAVRFEATRSIKGLTP
jgi:hypothetical protein